MTTDNTPTVDEVAELPRTAYVAEPTEDVIERCARAARVAYVAGVRIPHLQFDELAPDRKGVWRAIASAALSAAHPGPQGPPEDEEGTDAVRNR